MVAIASQDMRTRLNQAVDALVEESIDAFSTEALGGGHGRHPAFDRSPRGRVSASPAPLRSSPGRGRRGWREHDLLGAALRASFGNVVMIAHLAKDVGLDEVARIEPVLVHAAETFEPGAMRTLVQAARLRIDPDGVLDDANHAHERRWFECEETYGGDYILRGLLDAEGGALLKQAIDAVGHGMHRGEERSVFQRRADALVDMAATQLRCGDHRDVHGQRPHLTLTVSAETLHAGSNAEATPAELSGVGPIHPETARRIACDSVRTVVSVAPRAAGSVAWAVDLHPLPLSVGRRMRTIPAHIRVALRLRDRGCRFPGCDRKPEWTDGHHIAHWVDGGLTELDNLVHR
jgi:hypothetical protein